MYQEHKWIWINAHGEIKTRGSKHHTLSLSSELFTQVLFTPTLYPSSSASWLCVFSFVLQSESLSSLWLWLLERDDKLSDAWGFSDRWFEGEEGESSFHGGGG